MISQIFFFLIQNLAWDQCEVFKVLGVPGHREVCVGAGEPSAHDDAPVLVEGGGGVVDLPGQLGGEEPGVVQGQVEPALVEGLENAPTATNIWPVP